MITLSKSGTRATRAIKHASALLAPGQLEITRQFFDDLLRDHATPEPAFVPVCGTILYAGTDPGITRRMQGIFRQHRTLLADFGVVYLDQKDFRQLEFGRWWSSEQGVSNHEADRLVNSLFERLALLTEGMDRVGTVLIAHDAFAGIQNGRRVFPNTPSITSRSVRQLRSWLRTPRLDVVLSTRARADQFPALYATYVNRGGVVDPEYLASQWGEPTSSVVERLVAMSAAEPEEIHVDHVETPVEAIIGLARVDAGLASSLLPLDSDLATPFEPPRSIRASQIIARMNRHQMPAEKRATFRHWASAKF